MQFKVLDCHNEKVMITMGTIFVCKEYDCFDFRGSTMATIHFTAVLMAGPLSSATMAVAWRKA
jgi:hypothetical protein